MEFEQFAEAHGLLIRNVQFGKWIRVPTVDHPKSKNGSYKHLGDVAFLQNHATMIEPARWFPENDQKVRIDQESIKKRQQKALKEAAEQREKAANRAGWILHQTKLEKHAYLDSRGFTDLLGMVWTVEEDNKLIIPMKIGDKLVGCQTINRDGEKKFLFGQQTKGAEYLIDNKGQDWYCEGYASGLSLREVLSSLKLKYRIHICFSANNLTSMASHNPSAIVVADNDLSGTGESAAIASGRPYWMSDQVGEDVNDRHRRIGIFRLSQEFRKWLNENK